MPVANIIDPRKPNLCGASAPQRLLPGTPPPKTPVMAQFPDPLSRIDTWVFDLDNTLYPPSSGLFPLIDVRMGAFIARLLNCDLAEARQVQKRYFHDYGMTLAGLIRHHGVDPEAFLADVHAIALDNIGPCARLATALARLPGRRLIFTNADADYARRVLEQRGIADLFEGIFDIRAADYVPKPQPATYHRLCTRHGIDPARAAFVDDMAQNLSPAKALGMATIWLDNGSESGHRRHQPADIDVRAADLLDWLEPVAAGFEGA